MAPRLSPKVKPQNRFDGSEGLSLTTRPPPICLYCDVSTLNAYTPSSVLNAAVCVIASCGIST